jgi:uncharacterized membrane protein
MTPTAQLNNNHPTSRVSILARLVPAFSYAIPMLGAALSALFLLGVMRAMRYAEAVAIAAVAGSMAKANLAVVIALYLAIFVGFIGIVVMVIRSFMSTTTASPAAWFFLIIGIISLIPLLLLWKGQSLMVAAISPGSGGIVHFVSSIRLCLSLTLILSAVFALILMVASLIPLPSKLRAKRNWASLLVLVLMELALIGMAVAFQVRTSWFYQVKEVGRILP